MIKPLLVTLSIAGPVLGLGAHTGSGRPLRTTTLTRDTTVSFSRDILPIFKQRCSECHGAVDENGDVFAEEELDLTSYEGVMTGSVSGTVIEPGDVAGSFLFELVEAGDMPAEGEVVPPEELALIRRWIAAGALNN